ncbi:haloacid dehalogenase-like hydrolase [Kitasatospora saccharophila]|uniref:haloacid dehalogenase-like hydrolase n=1 Tax=Kitasatospora saccharophila TaxID=407973 RepID=UPI00364451EE
MFDLDGTLCRGIRSPGSCGGRCCADGSGRWCRWPRRWCWCRCSCCPPGGAGPCAASYCWPPRAGAPRNWLRWQRSSRRRTWRGAGSNRCWPGCASTASAGTRVVVATGCAEPLASAVCRELGLDGVELLAAELAPGRFAHRPVRGCLGTQKVARLGESGIAVPVDHAYTDSSMDLPLLRAAEHRYLVEPRPRTVARVRAALGAGFTVLD